MLRAARCEDPHDEQPVHLQVTEAIGWVGLDDAESYARHLVKLAAHLLSHVDAIRAERGATPPERTTAGELS